MPFFAEKLAKFQQFVIRSAKDAETSDTARQANSVDRAWDSMAGWFCSTDVDSAQNSLRDLYSPHSTTDKKIESFNTLMSLASPSFKLNFQHSKKDEGRIYKIIFSPNEFFRISLKAEPCHTTNFLQALQTEMCRNDAPDQLATDLLRASYFIAEKKFETRGGDPKLEFFDDLGKLKCTSEERKAIAVFCCQTTVGMAMAAIPTAPTSPGAGMTSFEIDRNSEDFIEIRARSYKDIALTRPGQFDDQREMVMTLDLYTSVDLQFQLIMDPSGSVSHVQLNCFSCK